MGENQIECPCKAFIKFIRKSNVCSQPNGLALPETLAYFFLTLTPLVSMLPNCCYGTDGWAK